MEILKLRLTFQVFKWSIADLSFVKNVILYRRKIIPGGSFGALKEILLDKLFPPRNLLLVRLDLIKKAKKLR